MEDENDEGNHSRSFSGRCPCRDDAGGRGRQLDIALDGTTRRGLPGRRKLFQRRLPELWHIHRPEWRGVASIRQRASGRARTVDGRTHYHGPRWPHLAEFLDLAVRRRKFVNL